MQPSSTSALATARLGQPFLPSSKRVIAFWSVVRSFWQSHKYQIVTTKQLLDAFKAKAGDWVLPRYRKRFPSLY